MSDFVFRRHASTGKWVVLAPRRAKRTNISGKPAEVCPFCIGQEANDEELYRVPANSKGQMANGNSSAAAEGWHIRVIPNKFPFTPHHEIIIHSPDHHKNIDELAFSQVELIFKTYRQRFLAHQRDGQVYLFHNRGHDAGESLPHPHTQLTVVPFHVKLDIPPLALNVIARSQKRRSNLVQGIATLIPFARNDDKSEDVLETDHFFVFCPDTSDWPDEVWIAPKKYGRMFGTITDPEITDLAFALSRLIQIFDLRHGFEFPFNFYIYPGKNWYLRLIPRLKILGGFELGTQVIVNTQDPTETFAFIREHFWQPDREKIKSDHKAEYFRSV